MTTEISPQSRISILGTPIIAPGTCILCGSAGDGERTFVDFGKQVDWIGAIYFCSECFAEVATVLGFIPVAKFDELLQELKETKASLGIVEAKHKGVTDALDILFANYDRGIVSLDQFVRGTVSNTAVDDSVDELHEESNIRESETNESDSVEGPDDVFDDSDFE